MQAFDRQVTAAGTNVSRTSQVMATAFKAAGAGVAVALGYAIKSAADFEAAMRNVNSISGLSEQALKAQSAAVVDLSRQLPQSAQTLAEGLYEIASSGFYGAEGLQVLEQSAKAASAGLTSTDNAAKAITAVLNAYGRTAEDAADVSDVLFQTVNLGVVNFEELTGVIGDTVGTAAAAKVSIDEVGAAIATMTLSGVSANEAGTSLNRLLQAMIDPSEELTVAFHQLGYESGVQALETDGLRGTFEKLRGVIGSNVDAWLALFPEVRAARAALGMAAAEGENYRRVSEGITDANNRQGATQRALDEQMKSTSAQFRLLINNLNAFAMEVGTRVLPYIQGLLKTVRELGSDALPLLQGAAGILVPVLSGLADALRVVGGFLADHPGLIQALAVAYGAKLAVDIGRAVAAHAELAVWLGRIRLAQMTGDVSAAAGAWRGMGLAVGALSRVALPVAAFAAVFTVMQRTNEQARELRDSLALTGSERITAGFRELEERLAAAGREMENLSAKEKLFAATQAIPGVGFVTRLLGDDYEKKFKAYNDALAAANQATVSYGENIATVAHATGRSTEQVAKLATSLGVDLTQGFNASAEARQKVIDHIRMLDGSLGGAMPKIEDYGDAWLEQATKIKEAMDATVEATAEAFAKSTDIIGGFKEGANLGDFLRQTAADAEAFVGRIQDVARRGLDPTLVQRLLEAGPAQAKPFLDALANDHSGNLIRLANDTQKSLDAISSRAIEVARVTQRGINAGSQQMAAEFDTAMSILRAKAELGAGATAQAVAAKLDLGVADVERIARDYVITWASGTAPMPGQSQQVAQATADSIRRVLGELPAFSAQTGATITGGFKAGLDPMIPNTQYQSGTVQAAVRAAFGPLPQWTTEQATAITGAMRAGLDPMTPKTNEQATATANALRNQINRLPGDTRVAGTSTVTAWLEALASAIAPTDARTAEWVRAVVGQLNTLLGGVGKPKIEMRGLTPHWRAASGGFLPRNARFQRPGTRVEWAEPETQGEWFFPEKKKDKNVPLAEAMLGRWGYDVVPKAFAIGGTTVPFPPDLSAYGNMVGYTANSANRDTYEKVKAWVEQEEARRALEATVSGGPPGPGAGRGGLTPAATALLDAVLARFPGQRFTSGYRTPAQNKAVGGSPTSDHMFGRAIDIAPGSDAVAAFGRAWPTIKQVIWKAPGHWDHAHLATKMAMGGFRWPTGDPALGFAEGGYLAQGLAGGLQGSMPQVQQAMTQLVDVIKGSITEALEIRSPSHVFFGYGNDIILGLIDGIRSQLPSLKAALDEMLAVISAAQPHGPGNISASGGYEWGVHPTLGPGYYTKAEMQTAKPHGGHPMVTTPGGHQIPLGSIEPDRMWVVDMRGGRLPYGGNDPEWKPGDPPVDSPQWNSQNSAHRGQPGYIQYEDGSWGPMSPEQRQRYGNGPKWYYNFAKGGIVPINAHPGEMVLPRHISSYLIDTARQYARGGGGSGIQVANVEIVVTGSSDPRATATAVREEFIKLAEDLPRHRVLTR